MDDLKKQLVCPHCGSKLLPFELPENAGWDSPFHLACFNDDCPYYQRGWTHLFETRGVRASYRYRLDPATGAAFPVAVWSKTALRDRIIEADVDVSRNDDVNPDDQKPEGKDGP